MKMVIKRILLWAGALGYMILFAMSSDQKTKAVGENTKLYQLVTASWLDTDQLLSNKRLFWSIKEKDRNGCTPIHHLMMHKDATVDLVKLFIARGAQLDVTNNEGDDPYQYVAKRHYVFHEMETDECWYNNDVVNFVHSEMLAKKLIALDNSQYPQKKPRKKNQKKNIFYRIQ
jgi:ankyrin repeat protein